MKRGYLIVFTGIDGSGKTTQANLLVESLRIDSMDVSYVWCRWEPSFLRHIVKQINKDDSKSTSDTKDHINSLKEKKQKILKNPVIQWLWLGVFFVDYGLQIFKKIRIKMFKKQIIVCDRMFYDSLIDLVISLGESKGWLLDKIDFFWMKMLFPKPDIVIYVDCPENIAFLRKKDAPDIEYLTDRRKLYLKLADKYKWVKIDGTLPIDEIALKIKDIVYKKTGANPLKNKS